MPTHWELWGDRIFSSDGALSYLALPARTWPARRSRCSARRNAACVVGPDLEHIADSRVQPGTNSIVGAVFDAICLRSTSDAHPALDLGLLAESLLFYRQIDLVLNRQFLAQLIGALGPERLLEFAQFEAIALSYCNQFDAVLTENHGTAAEQHFLGVAEMPHTRLEQLATELFRDSIGKSGRGRRLANRFLDLVPQISLDDVVLHTAATDDALDTEYMTHVAACALLAAAPGYELPTSMFFRCERIEKPDMNPRVVVHSNVDWTSVNTHRLPNSPYVTPAYVLGFVVATLAEMAFAARFQSDLTTNPIVSQLVQTKSGALFTASERSEVTRKRFQQLVFKDACAIREAVNRGDRSLSEALLLAGKARRFREWIADQPPDADLLHEYYRACVSGTWAERLSSKALRWLVVTGGGTAISSLVAPPTGPIVGPVIGTADALLDAIAKGWKPHQFVEKKLRPFVEGE